MTTQIPSSRAAGRRDDSLLHVMPDIACLQILIVNVYFVGDPASGDWVLVDAGMPWCAKRIVRAAEQRFGYDSRPEAIILTHGHFDHVGGLPELADRWDVPIYAHELELPYLTDQSDYPPPDPTVGGGLMARAGALFPHHGYDFGDRVRPLPADGTIPHLSDWRWIHTPGHSPGHVSLFRDADRTLIAGDAFVTQKQESFFGVMTQHQKVHGPPMYFTIDWPAARDSVRRLDDLKPHIAATGHGIPMSGQRLSRELEALARHFDQQAVPARGRYVNVPARADAGGVISIPPPIADPLPKILAAAALGAAAVGIVSAMRRRR